MANVIQATIELDLDALRGQLKTAQKEGEDSAKKTAKTMGDGLEKGLGNAFGGLKRQLLGLGAALLATFGLKSIIDAARKQEDAVNSLNAALRSAGSFTKAASADLQDFADKMQRSSVIGDETAIKMLGLAKSFGATNDQAKTMVSAAANMSAALGIDLETATRQLGATLQGSAGRLGMVVQGMKDLTPAALKAGHALDLVNSRFAGSSAAQLQTFSGAWEQTKNAFGEIAEELGAFITKSPAVIAFLNLATKKFYEWADAIAAFAESGGLQKISMAAVEIARVFTMILAPAIEFVTNAFKATGNVLASIAAAVALMANGEFRAAGEAIKQGFTDGFNAVTDYSGTAQANKFMEEFKAATEMNKPVAEESGKNLGRSFSSGATQGISWDAFITAFNDASNKIKVTAASLSQQINQTIGLGVANAFTQFGAALAKGQNAAEAFGRAILGVFADILIQLGTQTLLVGLAMSAVPILFGLQGGAAVAAGLAMLVAGGALKALSGGGGGGGSATGAGGGVAVGGTGVGAGSTELANPATDVGQAAQERGTQVTVNVQGNVFDRRQTGLELAEVIAEAVGSGGVQYVGVG